MFTGREVIFKRFMHIMFSRVCGLPSSPSNSLPKVVRAACSHGYCTIQSNALTLPKPNTKSAADEMFSNNVANVEQVSLHNSLTLLHFFHVDWTAAQAQSREPSKQSSYPVNSHALGQQFQFVVSVS